MPSISAKNAAPTALIIDPAAGAGIPAAATTAKTGPLSYAALAASLVDQPAQTLKDLAKAVGKDQLLRMADEPGDGSHPEMMSQFMESLVGQSAIEQSQTTSGTMLSVAENVSIASPNGEFTPADSTLTMDGQSSLHEAAASGPTTTKPTPSNPTITTDQTLGGLTPTGTDVSGKTGDGSAAAIQQTSVAKSVIDPNTQTASQMATRASEASSQIGSATSEAATGSGRFGQAPDADSAGEIVESGIKLASSSDKAATRSLPAGNSAQQTAPGGKSGLSDTATIKEVEPLGPSAAITSPQAQSKSVAVGQPAVNVTSNRGQRPAPVAKAVAEATSSAAAAATPLASNAAKPVADPGTQSQSGTARAKTPGAANGRHGKAQSGEGLSTGHQENTPVTVDHAKLTPATQSLRAAGERSDPGFSMALSASRDSVHPETSDLPNPLEADSSEAIEAGSFAEQMAAEFEPIDMSAGAGELPDQLSDRLIMAIRKDVQQAELRVNPQGMGPIQVEIAMADGQANVQFMAANPDTRAALTDSMSQLQILLANQGITLGQTNVSDQSPDRSTDQSDEAPSPGTSSRSAQAAIDDSGQHTSASIQYRPGGVDLFA